MNIKNAREKADFEAVGAIFAASWKVAYRGIVPQGHLDSLDASVWVKNLSSSQYDVFVIFDGETPIGATAVCAARDGAMAGWGEITAIYLLPEYFGKGYAAPLFQRAVNALTENGYRQIYLWVLEENRRARAFYEAHGFQPNGDQDTITVGGKALSEIRYTLEMT